MNFNDIVRKDVIYDNIKSQKSRASPSLENIFWGKSTDGGGWSWLPVHSTSWKYSTKWNAFCILFISSKQMGFFCSSDPWFIRNVLSSYIWNLKHLRKRKLQLLITTYLQISWHNMNLKLTLGIQFDCIDQWFDQVAFSKNCILVCKLYTAHLPNLLRTNVNFIGGVKVDISSKKLHTRNYF